MASTAITPQTLESDTFARKVIEDRLVVTGPFSDGYLYAARPGMKDDVLYRTLDAFDWDTIPITIAVTANPAAGADPVAFTCPTGKKRRILAVYASVTTDANVANRYPYLAITPAAGGVYYVVSHLAVTASITFQGASVVAGAASGGSVGNSQTITIPMGDPTEISAGGSVRLQLLNIQAGDDWSAATLAYKEAPA